MTQEAAADWPVGDCRDMPQGPLLTPWVSPHGTSAPHNY